MRCLANQAATDHNYARGGQRQLYSTDGQAVVSSRRNCDSKEQETGVDLALKLPQIVPLPFFLLSTRFATSLTFVFVFFSASRIKREFSGASRAFPQTLTHSPATSSPAPRREHRRHSSGRSLSVDGDSGSSSRARTLRQQGNFAEEHARPLPSSRRKRRSTQDIVKPRA